MTDHHRIEGIAAPIPLANLDTDQIMPKQFLRGIDKNGLAKGVLYDMRFDAQGKPRDEFVLNRPEYADTRILVAGANFGCGSSREHAVWGMQQYGIQAIIASSFGEIFYSNAMNNRLLLVVLSEEEVAALLADIAQPGRATIAIDVAAMTVKSANCSATFELAPRHHHMFMEGLDLIGASLAHKDQIDAFAEQHWRTHPWLKDVAARTRSRLSAAAQA
ncbi:MAG TPA: 3-isopropylmalate dehydratase small subunit [Candidimonas sp.]|nr:3-isopropylmalate dehydratase small subunit [Candidimonas sp.]